MSSAMPPIFVISLTREPERRALMAQELTGFDFEFFEGVDGAALDVASFADRLDTMWFRIMRRRNLRPGEVGCFLSHYGLWERLVETRTPYALILEDDARLEDGFREIVAEVMSIQDEWDIAYLAETKRPQRMVRMVAALDSGRRLIQCRRRMSGRGYLIRLEAAEVLLRYCWRIRSQIDDLYSKWWKNGLRVYAVDPAIVRDAGMPSSITAAGPWPTLKRTPSERVAGFPYRKADMLFSRARAKSK